MLLDDFARPTTYHAHAKASYAFTGAPRGVSRVTLIDKKVRAQYEALIDSHGGAGGELAPLQLW